MGEIYVDGAFECYTLEDVCRAQKIKHETAIPPGVYQVAVTPSARFKRDLPLLLNVPEFEGIRIHPGNTKADTSGCILVGATKGADRIGNSRTAFHALFEKIKAALRDGEKVQIEIIEKR
jgi:hypothetical protein